MKVKLTPQTGSLRCPIAILALCLAVAAQPADSDESYIPIRGVTYHVEPAEARGDGARALVYATFGGTVGCVDPETKRELWASSIGGFPFDLTCRDIDGDGRAETLVACADRKVYVLDARGQFKWTHESRLPPMAVAAARGPDGKTYVVCGGHDAVVESLTASGEAADIYSRKVRTNVNRVFAHDLDGDGADEVLVRDGRGRGNHLLLFKVLAGGELELMWEKFPRRDNTRKNWQSDIGSYSIAFGDVNGDGKPESIHGSSFGEAGHVSQGVAVMDAEGRCLGQTSGLGWRKTYDTRDEFFSTAFVNVVDITDDPGNEILAVSGGTLRVFSLTPKYLKTKRKRTRSEPVIRIESRLAFNDAVVDGKALYLGSTPNGDRTIYRIDLSKPDWQERFKGLERQGIAREAGKSLRALREQVLALKRTTPDRGQYSFRLARLGPRWANMSFKRMGIWIEKHAPYRLPDGKPLLRQEGVIFGGFGKHYNREQVTKVAADLEKQGLPFVLGVAHHRPFTDMSPQELVEAVSGAAPTTLQGFIAAEDGDGMVKGKNMFVEFHRPLLDWCARTDRKFIFDEKGSWWMNIPSRREYFDALFGGERGRAVVPTAEDSNNRTPELNLMARFGLLQAGLVDRCEATTISDDFSANRFFEWETPRSGSPFLRKMVCNVLLGADSFMPRFDPFCAARGGLECNLIGEESFEIVVHLLGKGLLFRPKPSEMVGMSRIGIVMHTPSEDWLRDAHNFHRGTRSWPDTPELHDAVMPYNGVVWGYSPTPRHALQHVLFRQTIQFGNHVPATPYGPVAIVPAHADLAKVVGVEEWWHTDGIHLWQEGGEKLTGLRAAEELRRSFEAAASKLPFRFSGGDAFFHVIRPEGSHTYHIYALDCGWVDPKRRELSVKIQLPGQWRIVDLLTQAEIDVAPDRTFALTVPAGSLRIVSAEEQE